MEYLEIPGHLQGMVGEENEEEGNPERAKFIEFDRRDAKRARGWARRLCEATRHNETRLYQVLLLPVTYDTRREQQPLVFSRSNVVS